MIIPPDNSPLYGSPDGYQRVTAHYDKAIESMGIPTEERYISTSSGLTHVIVCGNQNGKPVILWHGQNANATTWIRWIPALAADYCLYAVDTIGGMGKSEATRLERKGAAYGEWAAEVVESLDLQQANMIGASNGGWLILKLGRVSPGLIGSAVLLSTAGLMSISLKLVLQIVWRSLSKDPRTIAEGLVALLSPPGMPPDPFYTDFFELILTSKFRSEPIAPPLKDEEISRFSAPVCILMGQYERSFDPYKAIRRGLRLMPDVVRAEIVPGVGHSMEHRQPGWVTSRVTTFLEKYAV